MSPIEYLASLIEGTLKNDDDNSVRNYCNRAVAGFYERYKRYPTANEITVAVLYVERKFIDAHITEVQQRNEPGNDRPD